MTSSSMRTPTTLTVTGPRGFRGRLRVPGDKSISHRALLFSGIAQGRSRVRGLGNGDDIVRTRLALEAMGVEIVEDGGTWIIEGRGFGGLQEATDVIDCGNSGTGIRLLTGLVAGRSFLSVLTGDASIRRRPMRRVVEPLREMGATIDGRDGGGFAPLVIRGGTLHGGRIDLPVASAQVKTALVLAGLQAEGESIIVEPTRSRDHTERMLRAAGAPLVVDGTAIRVAPFDALAPIDVAVPGDPSSAAFFVVGALITEASSITIEDVGLNPHRIGFIEVLRRMGAPIEIEPVGEVCGEPFGHVHVQSAALHATTIVGDEIPAVIDELPILAVAAAFAEGTTRIRDASELRVKESDRIAAMASELARFGVAVEVVPDGMDIGGMDVRGVDVGGRDEHTMATTRANTRQAASCTSHGDHRVAMSCVIAASAIAGSSTINGMDAIESSYPEFVTHWEQLRG